MLIINTINPAGHDGPKARSHIPFRGAALALTVGALLLIGGLQATQAAMMIAALPFSAVILLVRVSLIVAIRSEVRDHRAQASAALQVQ